MRTAVTLAIKHDGSEVLIHGRTISIEKQKETIRNLLGLQVHKEYKEVTYQESDGAFRHLHFITPTEAEKRSATEAEEKRKWEEAEKARIEKEKKAAEAAKANDQKPGDTWSVDDALRKPKAPAVQK